MISMVGLSSFSFEGIHFPVSRPLIFFTEYKILRGEMNGKGIISIYMTLLCVLWHLNLVMHLAKENCRSWFLWEFRTTGEAPEEFSLHRRNYRHNSRIISSRWSWKVLIWTHALEPRVQKGGGGSWFRRYFFFHFLHRSTHLRSRQNLALPPPCTQCFASIIRAGT